MNSSAVFGDPEPTTYPYLGLYQDRSFVVLFTKPNFGFVVWNDGTNKSRPVGLDMGTWAEFAFERYNGKIVLENN